MIYKIKNIKNNIKNKNITILGAGISGQGAALLGNYVGANILLSDIKKPKFIKKNISKLNIKTEFNGHSKSCLDSDLIIISPGINPKLNKLIKRASQKNIPIISEIEFASWFTSSSNIIAVTGSNGKSTVVKLLYNLFINYYPTTMLGGNIGKSFSENVLNELKNNLIGAIHILELSSFQLEKIFTFKPKTSCILNVTKDHMDRYGDDQEYFNTKLNIIKNRTQETCIVYNQDDKKLDKYCKNMGNVFPYSIINKNNTVITENDKIYYKKNGYSLIIDNKETNLIGKHNLSNIIAAITICKMYNINNIAIKKALKKFNTLPHRMEKIKHNKKIIFINDSKSTNIYSTISAVKSFTRNIILILGGCSDEAIDNALIINTINRSNIIKIICYGKIGKKISLIIKRIKPVLYFKLFKDAVIESINFAKKNDIVLLSPAFKSFDQFKNFEERGKEFKKIVLQHYIEK